MRPSTTPGCLPLVTKLLGELPVLKRIHESFKRVVDMDYQIRGQCSASRQTGGPLRWDGNQKKMRGGQ